MPPLIQALSEAKAEPTKY